MALLGQSDLEAAAPLATFSWFLLVLICRPSQHLHYSLSLRITISRDASRSNDYLRSKWLRICRPSQHLHYSLSLRITISRDASRGNDYFRSMWLRMYNAASLFWDLLQSADLQLLLPFSVFITYFLFPCFSVSLYLLVYNPLPLSAPEGMTRHLQLVSSGLNPHDIPLHEVCI